MSTNPFASRSCGVCTFGGVPAGDPSSASVLSFSRSAFTGSSGIMQYIDGVSAEEQMHSATAYCEQCKKITWLCPTPAGSPSSATLNDAVVQFHYNMLRAKAVSSALAIAQKHNVI
jgi:hypothetical protein